ncbi:MAG: RusA family crossover junction endodeoxyribonuclease [Patescibacteria group bacterium]|nr:RusA family crossover junction endodeoxyribonuclease [Patescibacteria group bacterium]
MAVSFTIPIPPSVNGLWANVGRRRIKTKRYKAWLTEAGWAIVTQRVRPIAATSGCSVVVEIGPRDPRADIDNRIKAVLDLLVRQGIIPDDRHVNSATARWDNTLTGCRVILEEIPDWSVR